MKFKLSSKSSMNFHQKFQFKTLIMLPNFRSKTVKLFCLAKYVFSLS